jgi:hypothetical protein
MREQRNAYKGSPERPWLRLTLVAADGSSRSLDVVPDTGNPCALIVDNATLSQFNMGLTPGISTNFGALRGGWLRMQIPALSVDQTVLAYGSDTVAHAVSASQSDFVGLAGLPLLRMVEYGGDRKEFWLRAPTPKTPLGT